MNHNNLGVSLNDYKNGGYDGQTFFNNPTGELADLQKALEAGSITGRETTDSLTASGSPLKVESLENSLKVLQFKENDIAFWKRIPKLPAFNTVEEFNQLNSYGSTAGIFTREGELPREEDSQYIRRAEHVKFLGTTRIVTHPMQLVKTNVGNTIALEVKNGTLHLLKGADRALTFGDASIVPDEYNGFYAQQRNSFATLADYFASEQIIDLRGKNLREGNIEDGAQILINNFASPDLLMAPPAVLSSFVKNFYDAKFIQPGPGGTQGGVMGQRVQFFQSQFGEIELGYDLFMNAAPARKTTFGATHPQAPATPVAVSVASPVDASAKFDTVAEAGDFFYAIAAKNRFGESPLLDINAGVLVTVAVGDAVDLTFTAGAGVNPATGFVIYRSKKNPATAIAATDLYPIFEVSTAQLTTGYDGGAAGKIRDRNRFLPNCNQAILAQGDEEVWSFKQLAPLMKMDLAVLSPATRFMILMYGTPMLYAPRKMVRFINIGTDLT